MQAEILLILVYLFAKEAPFIVFHKKLLSNDVFCLENIGG